MSSSWNITKFYTFDNCWSSSDRIFYTIGKYKTRNDWYGCKTISDVDPLSVESVFESDYDLNNPRDAVEALEEYLRKYGGDDSSFSEKTYFFDRSYEYSEDLIYAYVLDRYQSSAQKYYSGQSIYCYSNGDYWAQNPEESFSFRHSKSYFRYCKDVDKKVVVPTKENNHDHSHNHHHNNEQENRVDVSSWAICAIVGGLFALFFCLFVAIYRSSKKRGSKTVVTTSNCRSVPRPGCSRSHPTPVSVNMSSLNRNRPTLIRSFPVLAPPPPAFNSINPDDGHAYPSAPPPPAYSEVSGGH